MFARYLNVTTGLVSQWERGEKHPRGVGKTVNLTLAANTFTDPQGEAMTYTAMQYNGPTAAPTALPSWLHFNGTTDTFTGTVPSSATGFNIEVTATDTGGAHASETFAVLTPAPAPPTVTDQTLTQTWKFGQAVNLTLAANTFTDPQGETMTYTAMQYNGPTVALTALRPGCISTAPLILSPLRFRAAPLASTLRLRQPIQVGHRRRRLSRCSRPRLRPRP